MKKQIILILLNRWDQIEPLVSYDRYSFHEDLRRIYWQTGIMGQKRVLLFADTQDSTKETILGDLHDVLRCGKEDT